MGARQFGVVLATALCLAAVVGAASGVGTTDSVAGTASDVTTDRTAEQVQTQQVSADTVVLRVNVYENGTAAWEVVYRTRLDDSETATAFRALKSDIENNSTKYKRSFVHRMTSTIRSAENSTGREMNGTNYSVEAEVLEFPQRYGRVVYSFQWRGFAAVSGDRILVGDALSQLPLDSKTRLLISWPKKYDAATIRPKPETGYEKRSNAVVWSGPIQFASNEPRITLAPPGAGPPRIPWTAVAVGTGALAAIAATGALGMWFYRHREESEPEEDEPPEDLLSNEEKVLRLLERRGGRVKQKAVVEEFGWTEAKTSQVVGSLREQGKIESFRLGRENVLALPQERQET